MQKTTYTALILLWLSLLLASCSGKNFTYIPEAGEMQTGPGLISGEDGVFTLYQGQQPVKAEEKQLP